MGCGNLFFSLLVTFSVALITYNIIISASAPLKQELPGPSRSSSFSISVDPIIKMPGDRSRARPSSKRLFHTAVTASDSVYNTWQCRIMYYWFKKFKATPNSEMGGFTRILHSGKPDKYMDEIPTFVAQPLPAGMDQVCILGCIFVSLNFIVFAFLERIGSLRFYFDVLGSLLWHFVFGIFLVFFFLLFFFPSIAKGYSLRSLGFAWWLKICGF